MNIVEITSRICSAHDSEALDRAILEATDFVQSGEGDKIEISSLFQSIVEQIESVGDREEALNCLSHCAVVMGSVREIDLTKLISLVEDLDEGETLAFANILANSDRAEYLEILERLAGSANEEISDEATRAMEELRSRIE